MPFTQLSDFVWEVAVQDLAEFENQQTFAFCQNETEENMLKIALGVELYKGLIDGLAAETPEQKWLNIKNGGIYFTNSLGMLEEWKGLAYTLKYFVFYYWLREISTGLKSNLGTMQVEPTNGKVIPPTNLKAIYNKGVTNLNILRDYIKVNSSDYPTLYGQELEKIIFN